MKSIVILYSRTGNTRKIGKDISTALKCDSEELIDTKKRSGTLGWMGAGKDAKRKNLTKLKEIKSNLQDYDLVIIGTPVWAWTVSAPIRTFLTQQKNKLKNVAFFLTCGGNPAETFDEMARICGIKPVAKLEVVDKEIKDGKEGAKIKKFINEINKLSLTR